MRILLVKPKARLATVRGPAALPAPRAARARLPGGGGAAAARGAASSTCGWCGSPDRAFVSGAAPASGPTSSASHGLQPRGQRGEARWPRWCGAACPGRGSWSAATTPRWRRDDYDVRLHRRDRARRGVRAVRGDPGAASQRGEELDGIPQVLLPGERFDAAAAQGWPTFPDPATLPTPRRDLWDRRDYLRRLGDRADAETGRTLFPPVAMVRTSFGCKMKCSFCVVPHLYGGQHRPRPVESVVEEIARAADRARLLRRRRELHRRGVRPRARRRRSRGRGVRKRYFAWTRSTTVLRSPELLRRWREIGLDGAFLGFEFPTDEELREARQGRHGGRQRAGPRPRCGRSGVAVHAAFMVRPEHGEADFDRLHAYVAGMPPAAVQRSRCARRRRARPTTRRCGRRSGSTTPSTSTTACTRSRRPRCRCRSSAAASPSRSAPRGSQDADALPAGRPVPPCDIVRVVGAECALRAGVRHGSTATTRGRSGGDREGPRPGLPA